MLMDLTQLGDDHKPALLISLTPTQSLAESFASLMGLIPTRRRLWTYSTARIVPYPESKVHYSSNEFHPHSKMAAKPTLLMGLTPTQSSIESDTPLMGLTPSRR